MHTFTNRDSFSRSLRHPQLYGTVALLLNYMLLSLAAARGADASQPDHPIVPGFDRFYGDGNEGSPEGGLLLLGELNCISCHAVDDAAAKRIEIKAAPHLAEIGGRANPEWLRAFIADPLTTKPGTTMPALFHGGSEKVRSAVVEPLVHYLASLRSEPFDLYGADGGAVIRGEERFHKLGCVACHAPRRGKRPELQASSVPLGELHRKYSIGSLTSFLIDPLDVRPSGRMPSLNLSAADAGDIAHYLLQEIDAPPRTIVSLNYYEGSWSKLPDFSKLQPKFNAGRASFELGKLPRKSNFAVTMDSFLIVAKEGDYTFFTSSDDGSQLFIDGTLVVNNDGLHGNQTKDGKIRLAPGRHAIRVTFFQASGPFAFQVQYQPPGGKRMPISPSMLVGAKEPSQEQEKFEVDPGLAEKGKQYFATLGCAACHELGGKHPQVASKLEAPPLAGVKTDAGCLSPSPQAGVPHYMLDQAQRKSLAAAVASLSAGTFEPPSAKQRIHSTFVRMNCYACHERDRVGGVVEERSEYFTANQEDLGLEGRIPPLLTGVGDKLKQDWLAAVLFEAGTARPYMDARMPQFGRETIGHLVEDLAAVDMQPPSLPDVPDSEKEQRLAGRELTGKTGLSCISCHSFHRFRSLGIQATDLSTMPKRLRKDWFLRYMLDPGRYRPGTRMPQAWPEGKSFKQDILRGSPERQILAIYEYLSDGRRAIRPRGLIPTGMELIVGGEALMYRNFIQGAGPRAIGVGYPPQVNLAFDANDLRLALIWQGRFIDASKHWSGRGAGFQPPAGEKVLSLVGGAPFAALADEKAPWPGERGKDAGYQFRGYRLDEIRRPTFLYSIGDIQIEDKPEGIEDGERRGIRRTFHLSAPASNKGRLWYRPAAGGKIEPIGETAFRINDQLTMRFELEGGAQPFVRDAGQPELLVPIELDGREARFVQEYWW